MSDNGYVSPEVRREVRTGEEEHVEVGVEMVLKAVRPDRSSQAVALVSVHSLPQSGLPRLQELLPDSSDPTF